MFTGGININPGIHGNAGLKQSVRETAGAAEEIDGGDSGFFLGQGRIRHGENISVQGRKLPECVNTERSVPQPCSHANGQCQCPIADGRLEWPVGLSGECGCPGAVLAWRNRRFAFFQEPYKIRPVDSWMLRRRFASWFALTAWAASLVAIELASSGAGSAAAKVVLRWCWLGPRPDRPGARYPAT